MEIYNLAPTGNFIRMWDSANDLVASGRGTYLGGKTRRGRTLHRIKWLFSSQYRKRVKSDRKTFVRQFNKEMRTSLRQGNKYDFARADMNLAGAGEQKKAEELQTRDVKNITMDLKAAEDNVGNEKAYLKNLAGFLYKTREGVMEGNNEAFGCEGVHNYNVGIASGEGNRGHAGRREALHNDYQSITDFRLNLLGFLPPQTNLHPAFRLQLDTRNAELAQGVGISERVNIIHKKRMEAQEKSSDVQNRNPRFQHNVADPVVFKAPETAEKFSDLPPELAEYVRKYPKQGKQFLEYASHDPQKGEMLFKFIAKNPGMIPELAVFLENPTPPQVYNSKPVGRLLTREVGDEWRRYGEEIILFDPESGVTAKSDESYVPAREFGDYAAKKPGIGAPLFGFVSKHPMMAPTIGHHGVQQEYESYHASQSPETRLGNSEHPVSVMDAFKEAKVNGAEMLEIDVRLSKDGTPHVCLSFSEPRVIEDATDDQLRTNGKFPTLKKVLLEEDIPGYLNIDIKSERELEKDIVTPVSRDVREHGGNKEILFESYNPIVLFHLSEALPDTPRGLQRDDVHTPEEFRNDLWAHVARPNVVSFGNNKSLPREIEVLWEGPGYKLTTWGRRDQAEYDRLFELGVDKGKNEETGAVIAADSSAPPEELTKYAEANPSVGNSLLNFVAENPTMGPEIVEFLNDPNPPKASKWPENVVLPTREFHRGGKSGDPGGPPENSMEAFREAHQLGAQYIEFDVRPSKDGTPYVCHDINLKRVHGNDTVVENATDEELQELGLIPTLQEVLLAEDVPAFFDIEIKSERQFDKDFARRVAHDVREHGGRKQVIFASFNPVALYNLSEELPNTPRLLYRDVVHSPNGFRHDVWTHIAKPHIVAIKHELLNKQVVDYWQGLGFKITGWTVNNDPEKEAELLAMGVNTVMTDLF